MCKRCFLVAQLHQTANLVDKNIFERSISFLKSSGVRNKRFLLFDHGKHWCVCKLCELKNALCQKKPFPTTKTNSNSFKGLSQLDKPIYQRILYNVNSGNASKKCGMHCKIILLGCKNQWHVGYENLFIFPIIIMEYWSSSLFKLLSQQDRQPIL